MLNSTEHEIQLLIKIYFLAFKLSDVVFMLRLVEHEKSYSTAVHVLYSLSLSPFHTFSKASTGYLSNLIRDDRCTVLKGKGILICINMSH